VIIPRWSAAALIEVNCDMKNDHRRKSTAIDLYQCALTRPRHQPRRTIGHDPTAPIPLASNLVIPTKERIACYLQPLVPVVCGKHTRTAESLGTLRRHGADERFCRQDEPAETGFGAWAEPPNNARRYRMAAARSWIFCCPDTCSDSTQRPMVDNTAVLVFHAGQWNCS
jgi:hypothetical protein